MNYCTTTDVIRLIKTFYTDVNDYNLGSSTLPVEAIDVLIPVASAMVMQDYSPRYDFVVIDAYDPDFPLGIVQLTALRTAELLYNRQGAANTERNNGLKALFGKEISFWKRNLLNGSLRDNTGLLVPNQAGPNTQTPASTTLIDTQYPDDVPRYY